MHVFISDVHIRTDTSYRAQLLMRFLREKKSEISNLYILGDLFEFWFEYNIVFPKDYFKILAVLYNLVEEGKTVHYILGNHEVMTGNLLRSFGFVIYPSNTILTIDGKKVFLAHGHKVDRRLWTTLWERLLTSKINHALYSMIHPDFGVFLAQGIAYLSRKQRRSPNTNQLLGNYARLKLSEVDVVIMAHSHIPVFQEFEKNKYYLNTGDWIEHFSYGIINNGKIELCYYKPKK